MSAFIDRGVEAIGQLGRAGSAALLSSFLQSGCAVCDRATSQPLCVDCQRQLNAQISPPCQKRADAQLSLIKALGAYDGILKRAILSLKYENRPEVAKILGAKLGQRWNQHLSPNERSIYVLPIPLHKDRQKSRGYNQAALLARSFCQVSGLQLLENGLVRSQATVPQHQLGLEARQQNLLGAFEVGRSLDRLRAKKHSLSVLLVDDIYTTGVTVQSAAKVLAQAGISTVGVVVVAIA